MRKNKLIQFMVTSEQYDRIKHLTTSKGFMRVAEYLRFMALEKDLTYERKFTEIHQAIMFLIKNKEEQKKD